MRSYRNVIIAACLIAGVSALILGFLIHLSASKATEIVTHGRRCVAAAEKHTVAAYHPGVEYAKDSPTCADSLGDGFANRDGCERAAGRRQICKALLVLGRGVERRFSVWYAVQRDERPKSQQGARNLVRFWTAGSVPKIADVAKAADDGAT
jgi:hypothetical protein